MKSIRVKVSAKPTEYPINFIEDFDLLEKALKSQVNNRRFIVVTDENVKTKSPFLDRDLGESFRVVLKPGEVEKNWASVEAILQGAFEAYLDRDSVIVSIGGGVIGDMTGFASSIFMRGIPFIQVPTTLLSMVDASIGGKTGIDCEYGKNLIGSFMPPEAILITPQFLDTLPDDEIKNGIGEMVKHGIIASEDHFASLEALAQKDFTTIRAEIFNEVIPSINIKKSIVEEDELEHGIRGFLNLGHTFGHAIEHQTNYEIAHGRAVAIGCVMAANYAAEKGLCDFDLVDRIENIFNQYEIDLSCDVPEEKIWEAMAYDKKKKAGTLRLILPKAIGSVDYYDVTT